LYGFSESRNRKHSGLSPSHPLYRYHVSQRLVKNSKPQLRPPAAFSKVAIKVDGIRGSDDLSTPPIGAVFTRCCLKYDSVGGRIDCSECIAKLISNVPHIFA
jgi:hypothetical protein